LPITIIDIEGIYETNNLQDRISRGQDMTFLIGHHTAYVLVPDRRSRVLEVVVVEHIINNLGFRETGGGGMGRVGTRGGQFTSNLGKRWTNPDTSRRVPSKYRE
jgi:hypothetical protein